MFRNLHAFRVHNWHHSADQLAEALQAHLFTPCTGLQMTSLGWTPPRANGPLVHVVNRQMLLSLGQGKKVLPAAVINQATKIKAAELEEREGFKPGRKRMQEIREEVTDDLLPKAFAVYSTTAVWIDPDNGWLVIDSASSSKSEDVLMLLKKCVPDLAIAPLLAQQSPVSAMTQWLMEDEEPFGFSIDQDSELAAPTEGKATVRYVRHTLEAHEMQRHIASGKQCTRLALTWDDRISFVLTGSLILKRIVPLDVLKEKADSSADADEAFDSDFALMAGEFNRLLSSLVDALGGEREGGAA